MSHYFQSPTARSAPSPPTTTAPNSSHVPSSETQGSQSGREFSLQAKEPLGTDSHRNVSKNSSRCRLLIGYKKCFVLLHPMGEHISMSSFRVFVHDGYCLDHGLSSLCTKEMHAVRKPSVWYKIPISSNSLTLSNASELFWTISKFMKRINFVIACLRPSQNVKLGIFTGSRTVDGKEMYKKAWCTCKVVVLPYQAIAYLTFSSPPHLKLPIIYDTLWSVKNRIFSGQIHLLLLIAS